MFLFCMSGLSLLGLIVAAVVGGISFAVNDDGNAAGLMWFLRLMAWLIGAVAIVILILAIRGQP